MLAAHDDGTVTIGEGQWTVGQLREALRRLNVLVDGITIEVTKRNG